MTGHYYVLRAGNTTSVTRTRGILQESHSVTGPLYSLTAALYAARHNCPASAANTAAKLANSAVERVVMTRQGRRTPVVQCTLWTELATYCGQSVLVVREVDGVPTHVAVDGVIYCVPSRVVARIRNWPRFTVPRKQDGENVFPAAERGDIEL